VIDVFAVRTNPQECDVGAKLFEYMAMAIPTVSSSIGEPAHIIRDGENGLLAGSREEFTEKMRILIEDVKASKEIGEKARKSVEEDYSLKILGERFSAALTTLL